MYPSASSPLRLTAADGLPVTAPCPHHCDAIVCDLKPGQCHERHAGDSWIYDPVACEREREAR